jgi:hypothetical protein
MAETQSDIAQYQRDHDLLILVDQNVTDLVTKIEARDKQYVNQAEFWPVKMLVYGCTGLMLTSLIGAIVLLVIKV